MPRHPAPLKPLNENGLNSLEQEFVNIWLLNGEKGMDALLLVRPNFAPASAAVEASRWLKRPHIQSYIAKKRKEVLEASDISLDYIVKNLKQTIDEVNAEETERDPLTGRITNKPDRKAKTDALSLLAKIGGFTDKKPPILIQSTGDVQISFGDWTPTTTKALKDSNDSSTPLGTLGEDGPNPK